MGTYGTTDIRNIALTGASGSGKTTLAEVMLHDAGEIGRIGKVEEGSTVCDYDDLSQELKHSLDSAVVHLDWDGAHVNIIDTPGAAGFVGQAYAALAAVETQVVMIDASSGIETVTRRLMKGGRDRNLSQVIIINKIDHEADLGGLLSRLQDSFGGACRPVNLPADGGKTIIDCFQNADGESDLGDVGDFHTGIVDQVVEVDEELMEAYLEQGEVSPDQLRGPFKRSMREGHLVPVVFMSAREGVGVKEFMNLVTELCPNPNEGNAPTFTAVNGDERTDWQPEDGGKEPVAHVFKVSSDPYVGKLCVFRVHQGHMGPDVHPKVGNARKAIRLSHVFKLQGKDHKETDSVIEGDIGAVAKVEELDYDCVLHGGDAGDSLELRGGAIPNPMFGLALDAANRNAEEKLGEALQKLLAEDPTLAIDRVLATGDTVLRGLGEMHLRVKLRLLKERYGVEVETRKPKVAYKETIMGNAEGHHRHKKQTGGAGQFGEVYLRVEPLVDDGEQDVRDGLLFVDDTFGGSIPKQFLPAIEKGIRQVILHGAVAGCPMQDIKVSVYDGKHHPVDSKEVAFVTAGKRAFIDAVKKAKPVLLEPVVTLHITIPTDMIGDISSDISGRRGRILGTEMLPGDQAVLEAEAPLAEVMSYTSQLRSITGGAGSYEMEYARDERTPPNVQAEVVASYKPKVEE
ncbi:MAG: elongation factor G [Phycisphaerales bacterium]|jgi:elongation factor G|nr:elongation factor G [Phycisphaerales bacterium]MDP6987077.1 elongation factor G [Phycisphaerales bacterium]